jgi:hypothetical protein
MRLLGKNPIICYKIRLLWQKMRLFGKNAINWEKMRLFWDKNAIIQGKNAITWEKIRLLAKKCDYLAKNPIPREKNLRNYERLFWKVLQIRLHLDFFSGVLPSPTGHLDMRAFLYRIQPIWALKIDAKLRGSCLSLSPDILIY